MDGSDEEPSALLRAGRKAFQPDAADRERVLRALSAALGDPTLLEPDAGTAASQGATSASQGATSASGGGATAPWALAHKWLIGCISAAVVAVGWTIVSPRATPRTQPPAPASAEVSGADAPEPHTTPPASDQEAPSASHETAKEPPSPARASSPGQRDSLRAEVRLLARAERELNAKRAVKALRTLGEHARRYPNGLLTEERMAARIHALCILGRTAAARAETAQFSRAYPDSAQLPRLRSLCGDEPQADSKLL